MYIMMYISIYIHLVYVHNDVYHIYTVYINIFAVLTLLLVEASTLHPSKRLPAQC